MPSIVEMFAVETYQDITLIAHLQSIVREHKAPVPVRLGRKRILDTPSARDCRQAQASAAGTAVKSFWSSSRAAARSCLHTPFLQHSSRCWRVQARNQRG